MMNRWDAFLDRPQRGLDKSPCRVPGDSGPRLTSKLKLRFDYKQASDGTILSGHADRGPEVINHSPATDSGWPAPGKEFTPRTTKSACGSRETEGPQGPSPSVTGAADGKQRRWIPLPVGPGDRPIVCSRSASSDRASAGTSTRWRLVAVHDRPNAPPPASARTNTQAGSSGSPCLTGIESSRYTIMAMQYNHDPQAQPRCADRRDPPADRRTRARRCSRR